MVIELVLAVLLIWAVEESVIYRLFTGIYVDAGAGLTTFVTVIVKLVRPRNVVFLKRLGKYNLFP